MASSSDDDGDGGGDWLGEPESERAPTFVDAFYGPADTRLGLQFQRESRPVMALARITAGSVTDTQGKLAVGMVLAAVQGAADAEPLPLPPGSSYDDVLARLKGAGRPLRLTFEVPPGRVSDRRFTQTNCYRICW